MKIHKVVRIGVASYWYYCPYSQEWRDKTIGDIFCTIKFDGKCLSITGVVGPTSGGNARGSCGQIDLIHENIDEYAPGWDAHLLVKFWTVWNNWHLNDMRVGCVHQQARGEKFVNVSTICSLCGHKLGSTWEFEEVPKHVLNFLVGLPDADKELPGAWKED